MSGELKTEKKNDSRYHCVLWTEKLSIIQINKIILIFFFLSLFSQIPNQLMLLCGIFIKL